MSRSIVELKEKMKIPEKDQKMICFGCGKHYLLQLYVKDQDEYYPLPEFFCVACGFQVSIDELGDPHPV